MTAVLTLACELPRAGLAILCRLLTNALAGSVLSSLTLRQCVLLVASLLGRSVLLQS